MPAFYSTLAETPSYACNVRVSTKTHNMHARHALQQNMDPWSLPQCLSKGMFMEKIKLVFFKIPMKSIDVFFSGRNLNINFKIHN